MDLSFSAPAFLWALLALPVLALLEWRARTRTEKALRSLVGPRPSHVLLAQRLPGEHRTGLWLRLAALALLLVGAAGPQWGRETVRRPARGSDLVFAVDVSASMDSRDVAPSRLDEARREALALLERVPGSRVGVMVFAGDAVRLCPLTLDHAAARLTMETLASGSVSSPGTDLGRALESALQMLPSGRREEQGIVLWTDGEDLEGHAGKLLDRLRTTGVRVFAVGVGTASGDVVPVLDDQGRATDVKKDENGSVVRSRLDERLLRDLARATHGGYFAASRPGGELARLSAAMGSLARAQHGARLVERPVARFPLAAAAGALLLVAELGRMRRRLAARPVRKGGARAVAALLALACVLGGASHARAQSAWAKGDRAFRAGRWSRAESLYTLRAKKKAPPALQVNLATAKARLGRSPETWQDELTRLGALDGVAGTAANYNLGTLLGEKQDYDHALESLRKAIERDPDDADARWNFELLMRKQQDEERKKQQQQPQQPKPSPQQQPQQGSGGQPQQGGGQPPPKPQQGGPTPPQQQQGDSPPQATPGSASGMSRQQAEQLLGSLQELERLERQRAHRARATTEKKGKDW